MPAHLREPDLFHLATMGDGRLASMISRAAGRQVRIDDVVIEPFPYQWGTATTAGLWRVDVRGGADGLPVRAAYFVKLLRHPRLWPMLHLVPEGRLREMFVVEMPWRFELDIRRAGIVDVLPEGMRLPVLHGVEEHDDDHLALWSEFVAVRPGRWEMADFERTALLLGRLAARRRRGAAINERLPERVRTAAPGTSLRHFVDGRIKGMVVPMLSSPDLWTHPVLESAMAEVADRQLGSDMLRLANLVDPLLDRMDALPQTFPHGDASPQNLLIPTNAPDTRVVIDWSFCTLSPVGFDLGQLLVGLAHAGECGIDRLPQIADVILGAYLEGFDAEGFAVDPADVETGFLGTVALRSALLSLPLDLLDRADLAGTHDHVVDRLRLTRYLVDLVSTVSTRVP